jgi:hypothetical protein
MSGLMIKFGHLWENLATGIRGRFGSGAGDGNRTHAISMGS